MLGEELKNLAISCGLGIANGAAYGFVSGCFVTLTEGAEYKRMAIYIGGSQQDDKGRSHASEHTVATARKVADIVASSSGDQNLYRLMTRNRNIPALVLDHGGCVLIVNFQNTLESIDCLSRFIGEVLPRIAPLTQPGQCLRCAQPTVGQGCPVMVADDVVVPMHASCLPSEMAPEKKKARKQSVPLGLLGAATGALIGAVLYAVLYSVSGAGRMACFAGWLMAMLSARLYDQWGGKRGLVKTLAVIGFVALFAVLAQFACLLWPLHQQYSAYGSVVHGMMNEFTFIGNQLQELTSTQGFIASFLKELALVLFFGGVGCIGLFREGVGGSEQHIQPIVLPGQL